MHVLSQIKRLIKFLPLLIIFYICYRHFCAGPGERYLAVFEGMFNHGKYGYLDYYSLLAPYVLLIGVVESYLFIMNRRHMNFILPRFGTSRRIKLKIARDVALLAAFFEVADCGLYLLIGIGGHFSAGIFMVALLKIVEKASIGELIVLIDVLFNRYLIGSIAAGVIGLVAVQVRFVRAANALPVLLACICILALNGLILRLKRDITIE
jgi:hypothetical protein